MSKKSNRHPKVQQAFELDGSNESLKNFYAKWATHYDKDTSDLQYTACDSTVDLLMSLPDSDLLSCNPLDKHIKIMDVGCGTGLMGRKLQEQGYTNLYGCDLSQAMVIEARKLNIYHQLIAKIDINQPVQNSWHNIYDCTISVGVFTPGHVNPNALNQLMALTKAGGLIIVSTRMAYYDSTDYKQVSDQLEADGSIKLLKCHKNAPYTDDSDAHYWAYVVLI